MIAVEIESGKYFLDIKKLRKRCYMLWCASLVCSM